MLPRTHEVASKVKTSPIVIEVDISVYETARKGIYRRKFRPISARQASRFAKVFFLFRIYFYIQSKHICENKTVIST